MPSLITPERRAAKAAYQREYRARNAEKASAAVLKCHKEHREKYAAAKRNKYQRDEQTRINNRLRAKKWNKENAVRRREIVGKYGEQNRSRLNEKGKVWKSQNRDKCKTHKHKRRALVKNSKGNHTTADWRAILKRYGHRCSWCGAKETKEERLTRDHYIALSKGGTNNTSNIVPACLSCNVKKTARDPIEFANSLGFLL